MTDLDDGDDQRLFKPVFARQALGRTFMAPLGIPEAGDGAAGHLATMEHPDFRAGAEKLDLEITPVFGPKVRDLVLDAYETPQVVERVKELLG